MEQVLTNGKMVDRESNDSEEHSNDNLNSSDLWKVENDTSLWHEESVYDDTASKINITSWPEQLNILSPNSENSANNPVEDNGFESNAYECFNHKEVNGMPEESPAKPQPDVARLEHIIQVQDNQLESLRQLLMQKEIEIDALKNKSKQEHIKSWYGDERREKRLPELGETAQADRILDLETELKNERLESRKWKRVVEMLKGVEKEKALESQKLSQHIQELSNREKELRSGSLVYLNQKEKDAYARVEIAQAKIQQMASEADTLNRRISYLEECLNNRDLDLRKAHESLRLAQIDLSEHKKKLQQLEIQIKLNEVESGELRNKMNSTVAIHRQDMLRITEEFQAERQTHATEVARKDNEYNHLKKEQMEKLDEIRHEYNRRHELMLHLQQLLRHKDEQIEDLRKDVINLEATIHANDKSVEIEVLKAAEQEQQKYLMEVTRKASALEQDALLLEKTRTECMNAHLQIQQLKRVISRQEQTIAIFQMQHPAHSTLASISPVMEDISDNKGVESLTFNAPH